MPEPGSLDLYINDNSKNGTGPKALDIYMDNKSKSEAGLKSLEFCIDGNTKNERRKSQDRLGMFVDPNSLFNNDGCFLISLLFELGTDGTYLEFENSLKLPPASHRTPCPCALQIRRRPLCFPPWRNFWRSRTSLTKLRVDFVNS
jgi:hypothetical protein